MASRMNRTKVAEGAKGGRNQIFASNIAGSSHVAMQLATRTCSPDHRVTNVSLEQPCISPFYTLTEEFGLDNGSAEEAGPNRFTRGLGLTPRLFHAILSASTPPVEALSSWYVKTIKQFVQSVEPSKNVMAQYWCP
eukprot:4614416-Amphidinium_carterae.1